MRDVNAVVLHVRANNMYNGPEICTMDLKYVQSTWNMYNRPEICTMDLKYVQWTWNMYNRPEICTMDLKYVQSTWNMYNRPEICTIDLKYVQSTWTCCQQVGKHMFLTKFPHKNYEPRSKYCISDFTCKCVPTGFVYPFCTYYVIVSSSWP